MTDAVASEAEDPLFSLPFLTPEPLSAPGKGFTPPANAVTGPPRPFKPGFLPDGTPLFLSVSRATDLADLWGEEFLAYYPKRAGEYAMLLYMACHDPAGWRDARKELPPLMFDLPAFRKTVDDWLDTAFRMSELEQVRILAMGLWHDQNETRVVPNGAQKKTTVRNATRSPRSKATSSPSRKGTPRASHSSGKRSRSATSGKPSTSSFSTKKESRASSRTGGTRVTKK
jgi:hypothetical protein